MININIITYICILKYYIKELAVLNNTLSCVLNQGFVCLKLKFKEDLLS